MFQIYLLTVLVTILAGLTLAGTFLAEKLKFNALNAYTNFASNKIYRIILGIANILVAIINIFPAYKGNTVFFGELIPTLVGLGIGILLISEVVSNHGDTDVDGKTSDIAKKVWNSSKPYHIFVGLTAIITGLLHAFFLKMPLL